MRQSSDADALLAPCQLPRCRLIHVFSSPEMDDYREYRSGVASALHRDIHQREYHTGDAVAVVLFTPRSILRFINVVETCCQTCEE